MPINNPPTLDIARQVGDQFYGPVNFIGDSPLRFRDAADSEGMEVTWSESQNAMEFKDSVSGIPRFRFFPLTSSILLRFPGAGATDFPTLTLYQLRSGHVSETVARIHFDAQDEDANQTTYARILGAALDTDDGDEAGQLHLGVISNATLSNFITLQGATDDLVGDGTVAAEILVAENFGASVSGKALLVRANEYAFRFDSRSGTGAAGNGIFPGTSTPTTAGLIFSVTNSAFEFRDAGNGVNCRIKSDNTGVQIPTVGVTAGSCYDTLTAGNLAIGTTNANRLLLQKRTTFNPSTLTIASGVITITKSHHRVDTESAAATDDLDTINGGVDGDILILESLNDARTIVVRHNGGGTGNIFLQGAANASLDANRDNIGLINRDGVAGGAAGTWHRLFFNNNA